MTFCLLLTLKCFPFPSVLSEELMMWLAEVGDARLLPRPLTSYLYWYVQKLQERKKENKKRMTEKIGWEE